MEILNYEKMWHFWLDDACYQIARGVRYLAIAGDCSHEMWDQEIRPAIAKLESHHGVLICGRGDNEGVAVLVAKHEWCFDLWDYTENHPKITHAVRGVLFGYDSKSINEFLETN